jgi:hypothetical protein
MLDLPAHGLALRGIHLSGSSPSQSPASAAEEGGGHLQIAQQSGRSGGGSGGFLHPTGDKVIRIPRSPTGLSLAAACGLALRFTTSPLPCSDTWIGAEPMAADAAGSFSVIRHGDYLHHAITSVGGDSDEKSVGHF